MPQTYFLNVHSNASLSKRIDSLHRAVFHGTTRYLGYNPASLNKWKPPATTNDNREMAHVSRSGTFVPQIFKGFTDLIVSEKVRDQCRELQGIDFIPVVFEHLVDVPMPALGDFSWHKNPLYIEYRDPVFDEPWDGDLGVVHPDIPELHERIGNYYTLICSNIYDLVDSYQDIVEVRPNFGSYFEVSMPFPPKISHKLLKQVSIAHAASSIVLREDALEVLGPHLDFDYFALAKM